MNIAPCNPSALPVTQMPVASTLDNMLSFETLMPPADGSNSIGSALPVLSPSAPAKAANESAQNTDAPTVRSELPDVVMAPGVPEQIAPPAPESKALQTAAAPLPQIIAQQIRAASDAKALPVPVDDEAKATKNGQVDPSDDTEGQPIAQPKAEVPSANLPLPVIASLDLKPAPTIVKSEPEIANVAELRQSPISPENRAIWTTPLPTAPEIASPAPIAGPVITAETVAAGHLDLARNTLWLDQLARDIVAVATNDGWLKFSLSPAALGNLDVSISTQADGVNIHLQPSTDAAARIFAAEQPKLTEELRQAGVRLVNSDLLGGQQMGSPNDHSQAQHFDRQKAVRTSSQPSLQPTPYQTQSQRGRFA